MAGVIKDVVKEVGLDVLQESLPGPLKAGVQSKREGGTFAAGAKEYLKETAKDYLKEQFVPPALRKYGTSIGSAYAAARDAQKITDNEPQGTKETNGGVDKNLANKLTSKVDGIAVQVNRINSDISYLKTTVMIHDFKLRRLEDMIENLKQGGLKEDSSQKKDGLDLFDILGSLAGAGGAKGKAKAGGPKGGRAGAKAGIKAGAKLGFGIGAIMAVWEGWSQISALNPNLPYDQYKKEVVKIIAKLADDVGIAVVSGIIGGIVGGFIPIPIVGSLAGFVVGVAAGFSLDYAIGDNYDVIADAIVDYLWLPEQQNKSVPKTQPRDSSSSKVPAAKPPQQKYRKAKVVIGAPEDLGKIVEVIGEYPDGGFEIVFPDGRPSYAGKRGIEFIDNRTDIKIPRLSAPPATPSYDKQSSNNGAPRSGYQQASYSKAADNIVSDAKNAANKIVDKSYNLSFNEKLGMGGNLVDYSIVDRNTGETFSKKDGLSIFQFVTIQQIKNKLEYSNLSENEKNQLLQKLDVELDAIRNQFKNKTVTTNKLISPIANVKDTSLNSKETDQTPSIVQKQSVLPDTEERKEAQSYKIITQAMLTLEAKNNINIDSKGNLKLKAIKELEIDAPLIKFTQQGIILTATKGLSKEAAQAEQEKAQSAMPAAPGGDRWSKPGEGGPAMPTGSTFSESFGGGGVSTGGGTSTGGGGYTSSGGGDAVPAAPAPVKALTADQKAVFDQLKTGQISIDDPKAAFLKGKTPEQLAQMGVQQTTKDGKTFFSQAAVSDQQAIESLKSKAAAGGKAGLKKDTKLIESKHSRLRDKMGIDTRQYNAFREAMVSIESGGGNYGIMGGSAKRVKGGRFAGAYQIGGQEIIEISKSLGIEPPIKYVNGTAVANEEFLSNPDLQEQIFDAYTERNHKTLMKNKKYASLPPEEQLKVLGYAHNQGAGGAMKWLNTGQVGSDAFGTAGTKYYNRIGQYLENTKGQVDMTPEQLADFKPTEAQIAEEKTRLAQQQEQARVDIAGVTQTPGAADAQKSTGGPMVPAIGGPVDAKGKPIAQIPDQIKTTAEPGSLAGKVDPSAFGVGMIGGKKVISDEQQKARDAYEDAGVSFAGIAGLEEIKFKGGSGRNVTEKKTAKGIEGLSTPLGTYMLSSQSLGGTVAGMYRKKGISTKGAFSKVWNVGTPKYGSTATGQDPKAGYGRTEIQIHATRGVGDLNQLRTSGCLGIDDKDWPEFVAAMEEAEKATGGSLALRVEQDENGNAKYTIIPASMADDPIDAKTAINNAKQTGNLSGNRTAEPEIPAITAGVGIANPKAPGPQKLTQSEEYTKRMMDKEGMAMPESKDAAQPASEWRMPYQTLSEAQAELRKLKPTSTLLPEIKAYGEYGRARVDATKDEEYTKRMMSREGGEALPAIPTLPDVPVGDARKDAEYTKRMLSREGGSAITNTTPTSPMAGQGAAAPKDLLYPDRDPYGRSQKLPGSMDLVTGKTIKPALPYTGSTQEDFRLTAFDSGLGPKKLLTPEEAVAAYNATPLQDRLLNTGASYYARQGLVAPGAVPLPSLPETPIMDAAVKASQQPAVVDTMPGVDVMGNVTGYEPMTSSVATPVVPAAPVVKPEPVMGTMPELNPMGDVVGPGTDAAPVASEPKAPAPTETPREKPDGQIAYEKRVQEAEEAVKRAEEREKGKEKGGKTVTGEERTQSQDVGSATHSPESRRATPGNNGYGDQKNANQDLIGICSI